jgi:DNA/RNA endonuclease G (NUC1)
MKKHLLLFLCLAFISIDAQIIKLNHKYYITYFDTARGIPIMAHHIIVGKLFEKSKDSTKVERSASFKKDTLIKSNKQFGDKDFITGYDRGHVVPDADMKWNQAAEKSTMLFTNCAPQVSQFNRNLWRFIETYVRSLDGSYDTIQVWTGCLYTKDSKTPTHYWKAIQLKLKGITINTLGFMCENKEYASKTFPQDHTCTVKHIESTIGQSLFTIEQLPGAKNDLNRESVLKNNDIMIKPHITN